MARVAIVLAALAPTAAADPPTPPTLQPEPSPNSDPAHHALRAPAVPTVILSTIPGHPSAALPGAPGVELAHLFGLSTSFDGMWWVFKANLDDNTDAVLRGSGFTNAPIDILARTGGVVPVPGAAIRSIDPECAVNDHGAAVLTAKLEGPPRAADRVVLTVEPNGALAIAFREGDPAPPLVDPEGAGDELLGDTLNSPSRLNDGTLNLKGDLITNIDRDYESVLFLGGQVLAQQGTAAPDGNPLAGFTGIDGNTLDTSPDGAHWIVEADIDPTVLGITEAVFVNGALQLKDGDPLEESLVDGVFSVRMGADGSWIARGDDTNNLDWIAHARLGEPPTFETAGRPIATGTSGTNELWGDPIVSVNTGPAGQRLIAGATSQGGQALVLGSGAVIARTGDAVDLDNDGAPDTAFIESFEPNDSAFGPPGVALAFVRLRLPLEGGAIAQAMLAIAAPDCNGADLDRDLDADIDDIARFVDAFLVSDPAADIDRDQDTDIDDIAGFVDAFLTGC